MNIERFLTCLSGAEPALQRAATLAAEVLGNEDEAIALLPVEQREAIRAQVVIVRGLAEQIATLARGAP